MKYCSLFLVRGWWTFCRELEKIPNPKFKISDSRTTKDPTSHHPSFPRLLPQSLSLPPRIPISPPSLSLCFVYIFLEMWYHGWNPTTSGGSGALVAAEQRRSVWYGLRRRALHGGWLLVNEERLRQYPRRRPAPNRHCRSPLCRQLSCPLRLQVSFLYIFL